MFRKNFSKIARSIMFFIYYVIMKGPLPDDIPGEALVGFI